MDDYSADSVRRRLSQSILDDWTMLRERGAFHGLLPSCGHSRWARDGEPVDRVGYVTKNYRVRRGVSFPDGRIGRIDLVETYWSIRTAGGVQDVKWPASLNAHAVLITDRTITVEHIDKLYRSVLALTAAMGAGGFTELTKSGAKAALNVRGLAVGSSVDNAGNVLGAIAAHAGVPIALASATYSPSDTIVIHESEKVERYFGGGYQLLKDTGRDLIGADDLLRTGGFWTVDV